MTEVTDVIDGIDAILLDFDGPVCSVFAGYPAPEVASALRTFLTTKGIDVDSVVEILDPLEVLRWVAMAWPSLAPEADDVLRAAEQVAVASASPTAYSHDAIVTADRTGRSVAIVSNNSEQAINHYLTIHHLAAHVSFVAGRAYGAPNLMKPHPDSVRRAMRRLQVPATACAFVGDSITDIEVSQATGVRSVGFAKNPACHGDLVKAGADVVIDTMRDLVMALDAA